MKRPKWGSEGANFWSSTTAALESGQLAIVPDYRIPGTPAPKRGPKTNKTKRVAKAIAALDEADAKLTDKEKMHKLRASRRTFYRAKGGARL
jgi:hypothetical protein